MSYYLAGRCVYNSSELTAGFWCSTTNNSPIDYKGSTVGSDNTTAGGYSLAGGFMSTQEPVGAYTIFAITSIGTYNFHTGSDYPIIQQKWVMLHWMVIVFTAILLDFLLLL